MRAVFDSSSRYLPGLAAIAVLPLTVMLAGPQPGTINQTNILRVAQQPLRIGVKVATITRPLDLKALSIADFGDGEHIR